MGEKYGREFCLNFRLPRNIQGSFTCRKVRHGTDGFTSPPKEDVLRIFSPENPTASTGFEPANSGTRDHRSRYIASNRRKCPTFLSPMLTTSDENSVCCVR